MNLDPEKVLPFACLACHPSWASFEASSSLIACPCCKLETKLTTRETLDGQMHFWMAIRWWVHNHNQCSCRCTWRCYFSSHVEMSIKSMSNQFYLHCSWHLNCTPQPSATYRAPTQFQFEVKLDSWTWHKEHELAEHFSHCHLNSQMLLYYSTTTHQSSINITEISKIKNNKMKKTWQKYKTCKKMRNSEKKWEKMINWEKEKNWENLTWHWLGNTFFSIDPTNSKKSNWEKLRKIEKNWEKLRKIEKNWENLTCQV